MNICNPRLRTEMDCDTKIQNFVTDLQRKTKIRVKDAPSLYLTTQLCFHYLVWSTLIHTGEQGQSLNIWFQQQLTFPSATCSVLLDAGPQSQGQGWGQNLKTRADPRFAKQRAQRAPPGVCWPLNKDTGLLRGWAGSGGRGLSSSGLGVWDVEQEQQRGRMGRTTAQ